MKIEIGQYRRKCIRILCFRRLSPCEMDDEAIILGRNAFYLLRGQNCLKNSLRGQPLGFYQLVLKQYRYAGGMRLERTHHHLSGAGVIDHVGSEHSPRIRMLSAGEKDELACETVGGFGFLCLRLFSYGRQDLVTLKQVILVELHSS